MSAAERISFGIRDNRLAISHSHLEVDDSRQASVTVIRVSTAAPIAISNNVRVSPNARIYYRVLKTQNRTKSSHLAYLHL